jgi:hypothetical protein
VSTVELRLCRRPPRESWLKPEIPAGADGAIVGWIQDAQPVESGVPPEVTRAIAGALLKYCRLTFVDPGQPKSPDWQQRGDRSVRFLRAEGMRRLNPSAGYPLTSTVSLNPALRLFETDESLWTLQSQVVLLNDRQGPAPSVSFARMDALMRTRKLEPACLQAECGCLGVMTPGPDGDFAQLISWQAGAMEGFTQALAAEAARAGLLFAEVSDLEFRQTRWFLEKVGS